MIQAKGYTAQNANKQLDTLEFERRDVGTHDVQIEILYCGVCHSDLAKSTTNGFPVFP